MSKVFTLIILGTTLFSCSTPEPKQTFLHLNSPKDVVLYLIKLDSLGYMVSEQINFDESGVQLLSLNQQFAAEIRLESTLILNPLRLYLSPGDSLGVSIQPDSLEDQYHFKITGKGSEFQNYLMSKDIEFEKLKTESWEIIWDEFHLTLAEYWSRLNLYRDTTRFNAALLNYDSLADWSRVLDLELSKFMSYPSMDTSKLQPMFRRLSNYNPGLKKSFDFSYLVSDLKNLFITLNLIHDEELSEKYPDELLASTKNRLRIPHVNSFISKWIEALILSEVSDYGIDGELGLEYEQYTIDPNSPGVFVNALIERAAIWEHLRYGNPAPDFQAITPEGDTVQLSDRFGKYLYLDLWATWCKPCIAEFPYSMAMMLDPRFKDFEFIFISIDPAQELWKLGMERFNVPPGVQWFMPNEWDGEILQKYNTSSIPRYIIISPEGKIINAHAPRPSQREKILKSIQEVTL